jgi:hypothetical protein
VHIRDYRYSADLDFTVIGGGGGAATAAMVEVLNAAREHAGFPVLELIDGDSPIAYVGPLEAGRPRRLKPFRPHLAVGALSCTTVVGDARKSEGGPSDLR